ncbi:VOC family protein [Duganella sp. FT50W]|uniref:Bleomycin resistance protein n=1 Tax=Duganella lactea TaxID=2692173 RepID=A0A6L8MDL1_9BURK|nr:VOC family protein [Duganella lactea]
MGLGAITPILRCFDEAKTREFFLDFLGFQVDWEHRFEDGLPLYMQVSRDGCVLHLSEHHGDCSPGAALRITTSDVDAYQRELIAKQYKNARPGVEEVPWGGREMTVRDPSGNRLVFVNRQPEIPD